MSRGRDEAPSNLSPIKPSSRTCAQNSRPGTVCAPSCAETRAGACRGTDASARAACRPRGPRPRPRPRGGSSAAPHRASRPGVRLSRAPLPGRPRLHSVLSSSHLPAGRGPPAWPRARVAFLPSFHRSRLERGPGLLLPSACPASPEVPRGSLGYGSPHPPLQCDSLEDGHVAFSPTTAFPQRRRGAKRPSWNPASGQGTPPRRRA